MALPADAGNINGMRTSAFTGAVLVSMVMFESAARADDDPTNVRVVVEGDERVVIEEHKDWLEGVWAAKCYSSCWLPIGSTIRIGGPGVVPSSPLTVSGSRGNTTTLDVTRASSDALAGGIALLTVGLVG